MKLLLARHGQTDWNVAQRFQGQSDIPLNEAGFQQAHALADRLSTQSIDTIYSSDLKRALENATIIAGGNIEIKVDARLREVDFGEWEGLTYAEVKDKHPDLLIAWETDVYKNAPPNGETLEQLIMRTQSILYELIANQSDKTILIVSHGGVLQALICLALNLNPTMYWQFHLSPASLSEIAFYPLGAIINFMNDTSHLSPLLLGEG